MEKRHEADLKRILERLGLQGAVSIPWDELYILFNAERISKGMFKEIIELWEELCRDNWQYKKIPKLSVLKTNSSLLTIFREPFEEEEEEIVPLQLWT